VPSRRSGRGSQAGEASTKRPVRPREPEPGGVDVIADFTFEEGLLFASVRNISAKPASRVSVRFSRKFRGLGGTVVVPELALFQNVELLAPFKEIRTLVDTTAAYFARGEPTTLTARVTFHDLDGRAFRRAVSHDLSIYRDVAYVETCDHARGPAAAADPDAPI
jgi:hypothetical protein